MDLQKDAYVEVREGEQRVIYAEEDLWMSQRPMAFNL